MFNYKIKFSKEEIEKIYSLSDNKETQKRLMSLLSYYKKYSVDGELKYSLNRLYKMYLRYHSSISKSYFYTLMGSIKECFFSTPEEITEETFEEIEKPSETLETTGFNGDTSEPNNIINNNIYNNTYTLYTNPTDVVAPLELVCVAQNIMKELKVKSATVKSLVISKLKGCFNINRVGMVAYITKVITEKVSQQRAKREEYKKNILIAANKAKASNFNNFNGRNYTELDYKNFENKLGLI